MKSRFVGPAEAEFREAVAFYDSRAEGLGDRFVAEVRAGVTLLEHSPETALVIEHGVRRKALFEFPYSLFYRIVEDEVVILAVAHKRRRPGYWRDRL